jgi:tetratricopeptide (TPR) repeat protein
MTIGQRFGGMGEQASKAMPASRYSFSVWGRMIFCAAAGPILQISMGACLGAAVALALQPDPTVLRHLYEEGLSRRERQYGLSDTRTARAASDLGLFLREQGDQDGARRALAEALTIDEKALGPTAQATLADAGELAPFSAPDAAEPLWQRAADSPEAGLAARACGALGELREAAGDREGAVQFYRRALAKEEIASGKEGARVAVRLNALALALGPETGIPLLIRALAINRRVWGERHPETATAETNLSGLLLAAGRTDEAVRMGRAALAGFEGTLGADHPRTAGAASNLADALRAHGDRASAERLYRRALEIDERAYGPQHPETLNDVRNLADFLRETGRAGEAQDLERRLTGVR